jgi:phosphatidylglycerol---prolipoprotein diacylglyceryl transferase
MIASLPWWTPTIWTFDLPILGPSRIGLFGPLVVLGIVLGLRACRRYARERGLANGVVDDAATWALVSGFIGAHLVALFAYHPERVIAEPWIVLAIWSGMSSTGGFLGALVGVLMWSRRRGHPFLPIADALVFGLLVGFTFGRLGCALVHDHVGIEADASAWLALGPWPCACGDGSTAPSCCATPTYRYDLGVLEAVLLTGLWVGAHRFYAWRRAPVGQLTGWIALAYGLLRLPLDALRVDDAHHFGLTFAQWACLGFIACGAALLVSRTRG